MPIILSTYTHKFYMIFLILKNWLSEFDRVIILLGIFFIA